MSHNVACQKCDYTFITTVGGKAGMIEQCCIDARVLVCGASCVNHLIFILHTSSTTGGQQPRQTELGTPE